MSKIWKWIKIIGLAIIGIGAAILGIIFAGKKNEPTVPGKIAEAERKIEADKAEIAAKDKEIAASKAEAQRLADEARKRAEDNRDSTTPDKPGDVGIAVDSLNNALK